MWLELTGKCQLLCSHCYASSGPDGTHGTMTVTDWERVIAEAADVGVRSVQFIGGEPTLHPALARLIHYALTRNLAVEVFSNLAHITPHLWEVFTQPGVQLATSWYTDDPAEHAAITGRPSHARTRQGIAEAIRRSIPLRVGIVAVRDEQRTQQAHAMLTALGVTRIGHDDVRRIGRAGLGRSGPDQLCGKCGNGNLAVGPDGSVWPCVLARWLTVGNLRERSLRDVLVGPEIMAVTEYLNSHFKPIEAPCVPKMCDPQCGPSCSPACSPSGNCRPAGGCVLTIARNPLLIVERLYIPDGLLGDEPIDRRLWPFTVPCVREMLDTGLTFGRPVTFFVGENGSGKSTVVEAIAEAFGLDARGGRAGRKYTNPRPKTPLGERLKLDLTAAGARMKAGSRRRQRGYFLRAETAFGLMEAVTGMPGYWSDDVTEMSHGEGFLTVFRDMFREPGLYLMDEPEAALSFTSCLRLVGIMHELGRSGAQVICATHSPILAATPDADIIEIGDHGFRRTEWEDLQLVDHWRRYLAKPHIYLRHITEADL
jgi:predicted ATPase/MoaA/NifB/PqqE/SkfB family radical SAM enzyme